MFKYEPISPDEERIQGVRALYEQCLLTLEALCPDGPLFDEALRALHRSRRLAVEAIRSRPHPQEREDGEA